MSAPGGVPADVASAAAPAPQRRRTQQRAIAAGVVAVLGVLAWLIYGGLDKNIVYYFEPHELLAKGNEAVDAPVRLGGLVRPGSVEWSEAARSLRFDITDTTQVTIRVASSGAPPQMFRDGQGVVVEGRMGRDSVFAAAKLIIMHSNEYRAPKAGERPQEAYKSLFKGTDP